MTNQDKKVFIKKLIISVLTIALIVGLLYLIMYLLGWTDLTREELQAYIESKGALGPIIYIFISFLQVTFVPIPAAITIIAGVYVFGAWEAFVYSYIGTMLGAMLAFALGRWIGKPFVNWLSGSQEKTDEWIAKLKGRENVLLFFMFFLPFFPDDFLCSLAGVLPITTWQFFIMQVVTRATSAGATILFMSGEIIPFYGWGLVVLGIVAVICIVAFILCLKYADKINTIFSKIGRKKEEK